MTRNPRSLAAILPQVGIAALVVLVGIALLKFGPRPSVADLPLMIRANAGWLDITVAGGGTDMEAPRRAVDKAIGLFLEDVSQQRHQALLAREILSRSERFVRAGGAYDPALRAMHISVNVDALRRTLLDTLNGQYAIFTRPQQELSNLPAEAPLAQGLVLRIIGLPDGTVAQRLLHEFLLLRPVLAIELAERGSNARYELILAGSQVDPVEGMVTGMVAPLDLKLGKRCFGVNSRSGREVTLAFDAGCRNEETLAKLTGVP